MLNVEIGLYLDIKQFSLQLSNQVIQYNYLNVMTYLAYVILEWVSKY